MNKMLNDLELIQDTNKTDMNAPIASVFQFTSPVGSPQIFALVLGNAELQPLTAIMFSDFDKAMCFVDKALANIRKVWPAEAAALKKAAQ